MSGPWTPPATDSPAQNSGAWSPPATDQQIGAVEKDDQPDSPTIHQAVKNAPGMKEAQTPIDAFMAGYQMSASSLPLKRPDLEMPKNASFFMRVANDLGEGMGDLPFNILGYAGGAAIGGAAGAAVPGGGETGVPELVGSRIGGGFGSMALPQAIRETAMDAYDRGEIHTSADFWHQVATSAWRTGKAGFIGAIAGLAGGAAEDVTAKMGAGAFARTTSNIAGYSLAATSAQAAMDDKMPDPADLVAGAIAGLGAGIAGHYMAGGGFKLSDAGQAVVANMEDIYRQTGVPPWAQAHMAGNDPALREELHAQDVNGNPVPTKFNAQRPEEHEPFKVPEKPEQRPLEEPIDTRGQGVFYHGTSRPIKSLVDFPGGSESNIYGQGLYTTDAYDVAKGYSKKGGGRERSIYQVNKSGTEKLVDMDAPFAPDVKQVIYDYSKHSELLASVLETDDPKNLKQVYDLMREDSANFNMTKSDVQEEFDALSYNLQQKGYTGLQHIGGGRTGAKAHTVQIHWEPTSRGVTIEPAEPPEKSFKTNPAKIAAEHEAEVSSVKAAGSSTAFVDEMLPIVRALEGSADDAISPKGAIGRYQIMPGTARQFGFDPAKLTDPAYNKRVARTILNDLNRRFHGDKDAILAAYNAGPGVAFRWLRGGRDPADLPPETRRYLAHADELGGAGGEGEPPKPPAPPAGEGGEEPPEDFKNWTAEKANARFLGRIGEQPQPKRSWLSDFAFEMSAARGVDKELQRRGMLDPDQQVSIEDMARQAQYGSKGRAVSFLKDGPLKFMGDRWERYDGPTIGDVDAELDKHGATDVDFSNYILSKRTIEKAAQGIDTGIYKGGVEEAEKNVKLFKHLEPAAQKWQKIGENVLRYVEDSTGIKADPIVAKNLSYMSLRRLAGDDEAFQSPKGSSKKNLRATNPLARMEGSDRKIENPRMASVDNWMRLIQFADRNWAARAMKNIALGEGKPWLKQLPAAEAKATLAEPGSDKFEPYQMDESVVNAVKPMVSDVSGKWGATRFPVWEDGKMTMLEAQNEDVARLFKSTTTPLQVGNLLKLLQAPAKMARAGIVGDPTFPIRVVAKHSVTAWIAGKGSPPPGVTFLGGILDAIGHGDTYKEWVANGGLVGGMSSQDREVMEGDIQKLLDHTGASSRMWNTFTHPLQWYNAILEAAQTFTDRLSEANRLGEYKAAKMQKFPPLKRANITRTDYLDYQEGFVSPIAQQMAQYVPFFKADLLGLQQGWHSVQPGRLPKTLALTGMALVIPQIVLHYLNREQDKHLSPNEQYKEINPYLRDLYYITPQINGMRFRLGTPYNFGPAIGVPLARFLDYMDTKDPHAFDHLIPEMAQPLPSPVPQFVLPPVEQIANYNFFSGQKLIPDSLSQATPDMQYTEATSQLGKKISAILSSHQGIGVADVSPIVLDNYVQEWGGTLGMTVLHALDAPLGKPEQAWQLADLPFVHGFMVRKPGMSSQSIERFYDDAKKFEGAHADKLLEIRQGQGQLAYQDQIVAERYSAVQATNDSTKLTVDEKRQQTDRYANDAILISRYGSKILEAPQQ